MKNVPSFSAVVLAAGRSTRMGRDKALLEIEGRPLWRRQWELLERHGAAEIVLSARPDQTWALPAVRVVRDSAPGAGPLAGIVAALEATHHARLVVLAVDLPAMTWEWFEVLLGDCAPGVGAVGRRDDMFEPLAAVYPREILPTAREALARGEISLQRLLARATTHGLMRAREIAEDQRRWFANWNEPADWSPRSRGL